LDIRDVFSSQRPNLHLHWPQRKLQGAKSKKKMEAIDSCTKRLIQDAAAIFLPSFDGSFSQLLRHSG
jgi:hypothetical protein